MRRVVAIANGKGGVGKTTLTAGLAGQAASEGRRVLVVDTDPQGNLGRDLGYGLQDGSSLSLAITHGLPVEVNRGVRDGLDVVPGGPALWDVGAAFTSRGARGASLPGLRPAVDRVRPVGTDAGYDLVLIDTPPGEPILQELVFAAADYLIIPLVRMKPASTGWSSWHRDSPRRGPSTRSSRCSAWCCSGYVRAALG